MKSVENYFLQFWAINNPVLLTYDDLRKELYRIWCEVYEAVPVCEQRLFIVGNLYRQRVLKGAAKTMELQAASPNRPNTQALQMALEL